MVARNEGNPLLVFDKWSKNVSEEYRLAANKKKIIIFSNVSKKSPTVTTMSLRLIVRV